MSHPRKRPYLDGRSEAWREIARPEIALIIDLADRAVIDLRQRTIPPPPGDDQSAIGSSTEGPLSAPISESQTCSSREGVWR